MGSMALMGQQVSGGADAAGCAGVPAHVRFGFLKIWDYTLHHPATCFSHALFLVHVADILVPQSSLCSRPEVPSHASARHRVSTALNCQNPVLIIFHSVCRKLNKYILIATIFYPDFVFKCWLYYHFGICKLRKKMLSYLQFMYGYFVRSQQEPPDLQEPLLASHVREALWA